MQNKAFSKGVIKGSFRGYQGLAQKGLKKSPKRGYFGQKHPKRGHFGGSKRGLIKNRQEAHIPSTKYQGPEQEIGLVGQGPGSLGVNRG